MTLYTCIMEAFEVCIEVRIEVCGALRQERLYTFSTCMKPSRAMFRQRTYLNSPSQALDTHVLVATSRRVVMQKRGHFDIDER